MLCVHAAMHYHRVLLLCVLLVCAVVRTVRLCCCARCRSVLFVLCRRVLLSCIAVKCAVVVGCQSVLLCCAVMLCCHAVPS